MSYVPLSTSDIQNINVNYYLSLISFTLLVHEYTLTFPAEVQRFWPIASRPTWAVGIFFINRYLTLLGHIPVMFEYFWYSMSPDKPRVCHSLQTFHQYFSLAVQIWVSILLIMRMYALYDRSRRVLALYLSVAGAAVIIACWAIITGKAKDKKHEPVEYLFERGCLATVSHVLGHHLGAAWGGMLVFDTLVFAGTVYKSFTLRRIHGVGLLSLLLRDGSIYFGVIIASNIANILTFMYGNNFTAGVGTVFTNVISSIMITRLMLNLRNPRLLGSTHHESISTAAFHSRPSGSTQMMSTFIDFRNGTEFTQFTQFTDAGLWSQYYHSRGMVDEDYEAGLEEEQRQNDVNEIEMVPRSDA
ncbi:hypothetical protein FPV67DRAFT_1165893 [Lyophyllum atratum]|nr:hypothetical protein FPV67DRAFT_1165893 [Lyophyllum atratum]